MVRLSEKHAKSGDKQEPLTDDQVEAVNANLGLVGSIAGESKERRIEYDDRYQAGCLGLIRAVQRFDVGRGVKFSTYASWWIKSAIQRAAAKSPRLASVEDLDGFEPADRSDPVEMDPEDALRLREVVLSLPDEYRRPVIDRFYKGRVPRGRARKFEGGAVHAIRRATRGGESIPATPPHWIDHQTRTPIAASMPSADDAKALRAMQALRLMPKFPTPFTPESKCPHDGPLPAGSKDYCVVCHESGQDGIVIPINVKPLPVDRPKPAPAPAKKESRKERRRRSRGDATAKAG